MARAAKEVIGQNMGTNIAKRTTEYQSAVRFSKQLTKRRHLNFTVFNGKCQGEKGGIEVPKVTKKFERLRKRLREYDIDQPYLAELLGCSQSHVSGCLTGRTEWTLSEIYAVAKICGIPRAEILHFFPPDGMDREEEGPDTTQLFAYSLARMMNEYINASKQGGVA